MYTILIADDNKEWCGLLSSRIEKEPNYSLVGIVHDGEEALNKIDELRPDIIILDIIMPIYDGFHLISHIKNEMDGYNPYIYVLSVLRTDSIFKLLNNLHIDIYNLKPVKPEVILSNLREIIKLDKPADIMNYVETHTKDYASIDVETVKRAVMATMGELGIPLQLVSTKTTCLAITKCIQDSNFCYKLNGQLYKNVAQELQSSSVAVERNMRSSIRYMMESDTALYNQLFIDSLGGRNKITNSSFLYVICTYIRAC